MGGPDGRACLKGRSQRSTVTPDSQKASARAVSNAERQLAPAPWVNTKPCASARFARWRKPRTAAPGTESFLNSTPPIAGSVPQSTVRGRWQLMLREATRDDFGQQHTPMQNTY